MPKGWRGAWRAAWVALLVWPMGGAAAWASDAEGPGDVPPAVLHLGEPDLPVGANASVPTQRPAAEPETAPAMGSGLRPSVVSPAHWPDDLNLSADRPHPMGLKAAPDALPIEASGLASWYADRFHGRRTASGELYSRYGMTAAHRDLPLGTLLHVSNPETGVGVVVRVNDRGPFHGDRVLDLSRAAAHALGLIQAGVGQVDIRQPSDAEAAEFARRLAEAARPQPVAQAGQKPVGAGQASATRPPARRAAPPKATRRTK